MKAIALLDPSKIYFVPEVNIRGWVERLNSRNIVIPSMNFTFTTIKLNSELHKINKGVMDSIQIQVVIRQISSTSKWK